MRNLCLFFICSLFLSCGQSAAKKDFSSLLSKVPVTNLPVGATNLADIVKIPIDWEHRDRIDVGISCEAENKYGLDGLFIFEDLDLVNYATFLDYSLLTESSAMIFAKRLPPINDCEFLIYFVNRTSDAQSDFPLWVLLMVDPDGVVLESAVIGGVDCKENDFIFQSLFDINSDYLLTMRLFANAQEDEEGEEAEKYDPNYMYETQTLQYQISIDGIVRK